MLPADWLTWGLLRDGLTSVGGGPEGGGGLGQTLVEDRVCVIGQVDHRHRAPAWGTERAPHTRGHTGTLPVVSRLNPSPPAYIDPHDEPTHTGMVHIHDVYKHTQTCSHTHTACLLTARVSMGNQACILFFQLKGKPLKKNKYHSKSFIKNIQGETLKEI